MCATPTIMARSVEGMRVVSEGRLAAGLPYLRLGQGAPLVMRWAELLSMRIRPVSSAG